MRKYPFSKQSGLRDCGPACIQMILKYYNGYMSLDKLSVLLGTNSKGTSAYNMVECLKSLGFDACAFKYDSIHDLKCPCIAYTECDNYRHYIVIYEVNIKKKYLIIGDPGKRVLKIGFKDFYAIWSGIVINVLPMRLIVKDSEPKISDFIINLVKPNIVYFIIIGFLSILICFLSIVSTFFIQIINDDYGSFYILFISFFLVFLFKSFFEYVRNLIMLRLDYNIDYLLSYDTFKKIIFLPYISSKNKTSGELISYFNDIFTVKNLLGHICIIVFVNLPFVFILSIILCLMCLRLFLINLLILLVYVMVYLHFYKKKFYMSDEILRKKALLNSYIMENINGYETVNNLNINEIVLHNFKLKYDEYNSFNKNFGMLNSKEELLNSCVFNMSIILILVYVYLNSTSGNYISIYFLIILFNSNFRDIFVFSRDLLNIIFSIKHIQSIDYNINKDEVTINGDINIRGLSKKINGNLVLDNINLSIKKGEKVFVTGKSGSGKSTLFKIVKGYYDYDGLCKIDNYDCFKYNFNNVVYVSSKEFLFSGRIMDNLNIRGFNSINRNICFINDIDCNDLVFEDGFNFSTGQRQRISLARALYNYNIIIIDEGLDGVDTNMERKIIKNMFKYYSDKTIIYISHRLDNLDLFERFIKISDGKIILDEKRNI